MAVSDAGIEAKYVQMYKAWCSTEPGASAQYKALDLEMECVRTKAITDIAYFLERIATALER
jgi:hypothetical protein